MRCACIDIGSNTTRLLIADCDGRKLTPVLERREFTRIIAVREPNGSIPREKLVQVAAVVAREARLAREHGAGPVHVVATAAIRGAGDAGALLQRLVRERCGLVARILDEREEATLAFVGAASTLGRPACEPLAVLDVGGGSTEIAVGAAPDRVRFTVSLPLGSGLLADRWLRSDPPSPSELMRAREHIDEAVERLELPQCAEAVAVGGSATSLRRLLVERLDRPARERPALDRWALERLLELLAGGPSAALAQRLDLDVERVRLLPGGLLILRALGERLALPLHVGRGGLREGVLLTAAGGSRRGTGASTSRRASRR